MADLNSNLLNEAEEQKSSVSFSQQWRALWAKNYHVQRRAVGLNLCSVLTPLAMLLLIVLLNHLVSTIDAVNTVIPENLSPNATQWDLAMLTAMTIDWENPSLPESIPISSSDFDLGLLPPAPAPCDGFLCGVPHIDDDIGGIPIRFPTFENTEDIEQYVYDNWFKQRSFPVQGHVSHLSKTAGDFEFGLTVMYNHTNRRLREVGSYGRIAMVNDLHTAYLNAIMPSPRDDGLLYRIVSTLREFPHKEIVISLDVRGFLIGFITAFTLHLPLALLVTPLVFEKENKLLDMMIMMGLKKSVYHSVNYTWNFIVYSAVCAVLVVFGRLLDFPTFVSTTIAWWIGVIFIWGHCCLAMCLMFSTFFKKSKWCTFAMIFVAYFVTDIGLGLIHVFNPETDRMHGITWIPSFALVKLFELLSFYTADKQDLTLSSLWDSEMMFGQLLLRIIISTFVIHLIAVYFEFTLTNKYGAYHDWIFFLKPSFYKKTGHKYTDNTPLLSGNDEVDAEASAAFSVEPFPVKVQNMRHTYTGAKEEALKGVSFTCKSGELVGIAGSNGAGKTTMVSALCGLFDPTAGNAYIRGSCIRDSMHDIYKLLGVCPQHDCVWNVISGRNHLRFYARIKGYHPDEIENIVDKALDSVGLTSAGDKLAGQYSGGMRRRLSLAIALLGYKNRVAMLDEATTGVDVSTASNIWSAIKKQKSNKTIILTSHSFEEINELSDRVIIMKDGRIAACGTPLSLKSKYGSGYKVVFVANQDKVDLLKSRIAELLPEASKVYELGLHLHFVVPTSSAKLSTVFEATQIVAAEGISADSAVSNSSLEEVFFNVTN
ncbi:hypothetical protein P9112_000409 [Eukaryota sp. TZLM1-RC]